MSWFRSSIVVNIFFIFLVTYLTFHLFNDRLNIQAYLVHQFEKELFEEKQRLINLDIKSIEMDLFALYAEKEDMHDELSKIYNPDPRNGETVLKLD